MVRDALNAMANPTLAPAPAHSEKDEANSWKTSASKPRWQALATDYDGTVATDGLLTEETIAGLHRWREAGRKLLLVTGREMRDFGPLGIDLTVFDLIVAENGGVLFNPNTGETKLLGEGAPKEFVDDLHSRGVGPISVGACVVATWEPHENVVMQTIKDHGLELSVIFNKGAVMVLPTGVNKASGLAAALEVLHLEASHVVGVGDAENDHAFLAACGLGVAVSNALPALKEHADHGTVGHHGAGVVELIDGLLAGRFETFVRKKFSK